MRRFEENHVESLFEEASRLSANARRVFLERACGDDVALRQEVESLLQAEDKVGDLMPELALDSSAQEHLSLSPSVRPGRMIGAYRLQTKLGEGGMSTVYLATRADDQYCRRVAIKLVPFAMASPEALRRFRTERHILASLDHPNIAQLYDAGATEEGLPYFVMEHIEGEPIDAYCDRHRLSIGERLELFRTVCSAVQYAHQNLVVHRDLKPSNILVTEAGVPKLLDFGIAKLLNPALSALNQQPTQVWQRVLTPDYASPEQIQGKTITTASDVYSLGVLLYQLLSGCLPHHRTGKTLQEIERIPVAEPLRPSVAATAREGSAVEGFPNAVSRARNVRAESLRRQLSGDLDNIVLMALRFEPQRRYGSAKELSQDLRNYLVGFPVQARRVTFPYRAGKFLRRNWLSATGAAVIVVVILTLTILLAIQSRRATRDRDRAQEIASFLEEIFEVADPTGGRGQETTARELLDRGAERIARELENQPNLQAALMNTMGNAYHGLGLYAEAKSFLESAVDKRRAHLGERHPETAESLNDLAVLRADEGELDKAETLLLRALRIRQRHFGNRSLLTAESLANLANLYTAKGSYEDAERLFRRALPIQRALSGPENLELAGTHNGLGVVLRLRGKYDESVSMLKEALKVRRKILGDEHYRVAESLNDLGTLYNERGDYGAAEPLFTEALEICRKLLGNNHMAVAAILNNLGFSRYQQGDYAFARAYFSESLEIKKALFPPEHPRIVNSMGNLASLLDETGAYRAAEALHREVLSLERRIYGEENPNVSTTLENLATSLRHQARFDEAEALQRQSLRMRRRLLGAEHPDIARGLDHLGILLAGKGAYDEAESLILEALALRQKLFGVEHPEVARSLSNLALPLMEKGDYTGAKDRYLEALAMRRKLLGNAHRNVASTLLGLGSLHARLGEPHAAEPLLREALAIRRSSLPEPHPLIAEAESALGTCLIKLQRFEEAEPLLRQGYRTLEEKLGRAHRNTVRALERLIEGYELMGKAPEAASYRSLLP